jgi:hypothetical protein
MKLSLDVQLSWFERRTPSMDDSPEFLAISKVVRVAMTARDKPEHRYHVGANFRVYSPQCGQIESAAVLCVPPAQQKFGCPSALSCIGLRYSY